MLIHKFFKRGAVQTEYLIILAFVAALAVSFSSDGDLLKTASNAAADAKDAIIVALGGEVAKINPNLKFGLNLDPYKAAISDIVDKVYSKFNLPDKPLASIHWSADGTIDYVSYYDDTENGSYKTLKGEDIQATYNVSNINDLAYATSMTPPNIGHLAFNTEGQIIKQLRNQASNTEYSHINLQSVANNEKLVQIEGDVNGNSLTHNSFTKVDYTKLSNNANSGSSIDDFDKK